MAMDQDGVAILHKVAQIILEKKGFNILLLDVRGHCTLTDFFIIAEGSANRHVLALADNIQEELKSMGYLPVHIEGREEGDWVVLDYFDFVIHLFKPGLRDLYRLEELWHEGTLIPIEQRSEDVACR